MSSSFNQGDLVAINGEGYVVPCNDGDDSIGIIGTVVDVLDDNRVNIQLNMISDIGASTGIVTVSTMKRENKTLDDVILIDGKIIIKELEQKNKLHTTKKIIDRRLDAI